MYTDLVEEYVAPYSEIPLKKEIIKLNLLELTQK